jgi:hypothetical protein
MKRVVYGKTYNTDTATLAMRREYDNPDGYETTAALFQARGGAFFEVHQWETADGTLKTYFQELTRKQVDELVRQTDNLEIIDRQAVSEPPEAA